MEEAGAKLPTNENWIRSRGSTRRDVCIAAVKSVGVIPYLDTVPIAPQSGVMTARRQ